MRSYKFNSTIAKITSSFHVILFMLILIPFFTLVYLTTYQSVYSNQGYPFCLLDALAVASVPWFFVFAVVFLNIYLNLHMTKFDYNTYTVIKRKQKWKCWFYQIISIIATAFFTTTLYTTASLIIGNLLKTSEPNWNSVNSWLYLQTRQTSEITVFQAALLFFSTLFVLNMLVSTLMLLSKWLFDNYMPGLVIIAILIWLDLSGIPLLFRTMSLSYSKIMIENSYQGVWIGSIILLILWGIGYFCAKDREFYDNL